jgi:hypothetical protein
VQAVVVALATVVVLVRVLLQRHVAHVVRLVRLTPAHAVLVVLRLHHLLVVDVRLAEDHVEALAADHVVETVADEVVAKCRPSTFLVTLT